MKNRISILLLAILLIAFSYQSCQVSELNQRINKLSYISEEQARGIDTLIQKSETMRDNFSNLYHISISHENCVALSVYGTDDNYK